jgi:hypothetical protein
LNASHNSQAERDYLRSRILEIFEEDERAVSQMEPIREESSDKMRKDRGRKEGHSDASRRPRSSEGHHRQKHNDTNDDKHRRGHSAERAFPDSSDPDEGFEDHQESSTTSAKDLNQSTVTSGIGSDDLESRTSIQFIDSVNPVQQQKSSQKSSINSQKSSINSHNNVSIVKMKIQKFFLNDVYYCF